jgi:hypothetical protein
MNSEVLDVKRGDCQGHLVFGSELPSGAQKRTRVSLRWGTGVPGIPAGATTLRTDSQAGDHFPVRAWM